ncbi:MULTISPECIES: Ycf66 family protein [unclassified Synechocystis]|uniref:Ycf66 family protein n=1 Tax=unclassified Synechocystis TaxID=2640012 RepID=UPI00041D40A1|nr:MULTISPECIES: Ycf66 family protein [unclassified Synechocystis]AIE72890.1 putative membrane protein Ycf66, conserved in cyanobacteria [Synechocystis sp. PCC 6714]MCT0252626.1 Ycf66 family protein [Synechocystis sp. CS-94]
MVNFGLNSASILGIFLAVAGAGLYFLRSVRPEVSRDYDIFFSAVGLLCGLILLFQGWRLDPILQFGQLLLSGSTVFFATETIRLRGITTEQARRSAPYADDRRVSKTRVYTEAELDQLEPEDEPLARNDRRLRGYDDDARSGRPDGYGEADARPKPRSSGRSAPPSNPRPTRPRPPSGRSAPQRPTPGYSDSYGYRDDYSGWDSSGNDVWDDPTPNRRPPTRRPRPEAGNEPGSSRRPNNRRPRPSNGPIDDSFGDRPERNAPRNARPYEDEPPAAYVDYQPIDEADLAPRPTTPEDSTDRDREQNRSVNPRNQSPSRPPVDGEERFTGADDQERFDY